MTKYEGSCDCGDVKVTAEISDPSGGIICHCGECKLRYGPYNAVFAVPEDDYKVVSGKDSLKSWSYTGASGNPVPCSFCSNCGVNMFRKEATLPGLTVVIASTLKEGWESGKLRPTQSLLTSRALPWISEVGTFKNL
ncbi:Mss4-like protein [Kockiozyma suomiensis]|uniref:Mss4-like protein n=1 Tax=Kockiozyma suomiensis TaxID=1337062 RepID=UPI003343A571